MSHYHFTMKNWNHPLPLLSQDFPTLIIPLWSNEWEVKWLRAQYNKDNRINKKVKHVHSKNKTKPKIKITYNLQTQIYLLLTLWVIFFQCHWWVTTIFFLCWKCLFIMLLAHFLLWNLIFSSGFFKYIHSFILIHLYLYIIYLCLYR